MPPQFEADTRAPNPELLAIDHSSCVRAHAECMFLLIPVMSSGRVRFREVGKRIVARPSVYGRAAGLTRMLPPYKAAVVLALAHLPGAARAAQDLTLDANTRAAIQEAEAELFELRPDHLGNSRYSQLPKDLFCDTCQRAISVLQQARDEEMQKPEEERSRHAVHLGYHIKVSAAHNTTRAPNSTGPVPLQAVRGCSTSAPSSLTRSLPCPAVCASTAPSHQAVPRQEL